MVTALVYTPKVTASDALGGPWGVLGGPRRSSRLVGKCRGGGRGPEGAPGVPEGGPGRAQGGQGGPRGVPGGSMEGLWGANQLALGRAQEGPWSPQGPKVQASICIPMLTALVYTAKVTASDAQQ